MRSRFSASATQHQVGVAARADEREGLQQVVGREVLAGGEELALVAPRARSASSRRQAGSTFRNVYLTKWRSGTSFTKDSGGSMTSGFAAPWTAGHGR